MKNIWKRSLSMLLALVLVLGMVPVHIQAAEETEEKSYDYAVGDQGQVVGNDTAYPSGTIPPLTVWADPTTNLLSPSCGKTTHSAHSELCLNCGHADGHTITCYGSNVEWIVCPGESETHTHSHTKSGVDVYQDETLKSTWQPIYDAAADLAEEAYKVKEGYYSLGNSYPDKIKKGVIEAALYGVRLTAGAAAVQEKTFCYTANESDLVCGHGSSHVEMCYGNYICPGYTHSHSEPDCYTYTWTLKDDKNDNEIADESESYTVVYTDGVAGKEIFADVQNSGLALGADTPAIADPTWENYIFTGWTPTWTETVACPTVKGSTTITYTATWKPVNDNNSNDLADEDETYTVIYVDGFGNELKKFEEVGYNATTPTIADPEKEGYQFLYWSPEVVGNVATPTSGTTIIYTAIWKQLGKFAVTFVDRDSKITIEYYEGERAEMPEDPTWDADHDFLGWYNGSALYDFNTVFTAESEDLVLTAKWQEDYNRDDINDADQPKYTVTYMNGYTDTPILSETVLVNMPTPGVAEPVREGYTFTGWDVAWSATVTGNVTYTATWIKDVNQNEVDDALETITVIIEGAGTVVINGAQTGTLIYDSTVTDTITVTATPVLNGDVSTTYVSSIVVDNGENVIVAGGYNNFAYTYTFTPNKSQTVTVTFTEAKFTLDEDGEMRFYQGIELPDKETLYNAVIAGPAYNAQYVTTVQYKAREAGKYPIYIPLIADLGLLGKLGDTTIEVDLEERWLDVGEPFEDLTDAEIQEIVDGRIAQIKALINDKDYTGAWNAFRDLAAVLSEDLKDVGCHAFGYNANPDVAATETLHIVYENAAMRIEDKTIVVTLVDDRASAYISGSNVTFEYDEFTNESLEEAIAAILTDAEGNPVAGQVVMVDKLEGKDVGEYAVTLKFAGNYDYKPAETTVTLTVIQAPASVDVPNVNVFYGEAYNALPTITNKHGIEIDIDTIRFVVGLDVAELDINADGVIGLKATAQILIPDELQSVLSLIGLENGYTTTLSELTATLQNAAGTLENWGVTNETIDNLVAALESISKISETADIQVTLGGDYPTDIGVYLHGAVTSDGNYETAFDVGYIIIKPNAQKVYLDFNYRDANNVFTWELLQYIDLNTSAYDDEALTAKNDAATALVQNLFFGIDEKGELVTTLDSTTLGNGAYTQLSFIAEFGNEFYYAEPIVRAFVIVPNLLDVQIVDGQGNALDEFNYVFDNTGKSHFVTVDGQRVEAEIHYVGLQTNTNTYNSTVAPKHAGAYVAYVIYAAYNDAGELTGAGFDTAAVVIKPADSTISVTGGTVDYDGKEHSAIVDAQGSGVTAPDVTLISGTANVTGEITQIGLEAITGNVNVDFPKWLDKILSVQFADAYANGVAAEDLIYKLEQHQAALVELGISEDMIADVIAVLEKIPATVTVTFNDGVTYTAPGVYVFVGVVTDSDHMPSADTGLLVIQKEYLDFELQDTTVTQNGQEHFADIVNPENSDYVAVIIDRENNMGNIILEDDMNALVAVLEETLGRKLPVSIDVASMHAAIDKILSDIESVEDLPVNAVETLQQIRTALDKLPQTGTVTINGALPSAAGTYEVYAITYSAQYQTTTASAMLEILPVQVKIEIEDASKYYGQDDPDFVYTVKYYDHLGNELADAGIVSVELNRAPGQNAGKYGITATVTNTDEKNYEIIAVTEDAVLEIKPAEITITVDNNGKVYGENDPTLSYNAAVSEGKGVIGSDLVITLDRADGEDVGTYAITATVAENANYKIISNVDGLFTIEAKEITEADVVINGELTYNGTEQTQGVTVTDGITYDVTGNTGTNAGGYTLTVIGNGNYTGEVKLDWTIAKAEVKITLENVTIDVDDQVPQLNYTVTDVKGTVPAELLNLKVSVDVEKNAAGQNVVGSYQIKAEYAESDNWTVSVADAALTVELGDYVCWNMQTGVYYATAAQALMDAEATQTIQMLKDSNEEKTVLAVINEVTLDLNGFQLTCYGLAAFNGNHVIDTSANTTGLLIVPKDNLSLMADNKELPIWNETNGYAFVTPNTSAELNYQYFEKCTEDGFYFEFRPGFGYINGESVRSTYFATNGGADNGLTMVLRMTWVNSLGQTVHQDFVYEDDFFYKAYQSGQAFFVDVTGAGAIGEITINAVIVSDSGVEFVGESATYSSAATTSAE